MIQKTSVARTDPAKTPVKTRKARINSKSETTLCESSGDGRTKRASALQLVEGHQIHEILTEAGPIAHMKKKLLSFLALRRRSFADKRGQLPNSQQSSPILQWTSPSRSKVHRYSNERARVADSGISWVELGSPRNDLFLVVPRFPRTRKFNILLQVRC